MNPYNFFLCLLSTCFVRETIARLQGQGIIGGKIAKTRQFPYQVSLQIFGRNICGGGVIDKRHVITAAHCVYTAKNKFVSVPIKVVAGVNDLGISDNRVMINVAEAFVPKEYDPLVRPVYSAVGDIAVLKLQRDLDLEDNPYIANVKLPKTDENYKDIKATVSGFGYNKINVYKDPETGKYDEEGSSDGKLRFAKTNVLTNTDCQAHYKGRIYDKHLCARVVQHDPNTPEGFCTGDSGSPLIYNNTVIAVASISPLGCSERKKPGIYTRVSNHLHFVEKVINGQVDDEIRSDTLPLFG